MENEKNARLEAVKLDAPVVGAAAADEPPKNKRRPFIIVGLIVGGMALAIGGYLVLTAGEENTDDAQVMADMVPVGTRVAGQIVKVHVIENERV
ncbi:MAG TPA: hypothetical protein VIA18_26445, partial [Polyangia bacterium]|nr:hypothetical protein [Polyangia bacterium]